VGKPSLVTYDVVVIISRAFFMGQDESHITEIKGVQAKRGREVSL
jgi:hypothetical protein